MDENVSIGVIVSMRAAPNTLHRAFESTTTFTTVTDLGLVYELVGEWRKRASRVFKYGVAYIEGCNGETMLWLAWQGIGLAHPHITIPLQHLPAPGGIET